MYRGSIFLFREKIENGETFVKTSCSFFCWNGTLLLQATLGPTSEYVCCCVRKVFKNLLVIHIIQIMKRQGLRDVIPTRPQSKTSVIVLIQWRDGHYYFYYNVLLTEVLPSF